MNLRMTVQKSPKVPEDFRHKGNVVRIGRNPDGELVLDHDAVSWDHARIELSPYQATLVDLGSTNGTFKNGQKLNGSAPLWPGDTIKFGQSGPTLTIQELDLAAEGPVPPPVPVPPTIKPARKAAPVVSETRGIAMQAVQELMAQQEAHARHKRTFTAVTAGLALLLLLLAFGLFYFRNELGLAIGKQGEQISKVKDDVEQQRAEFGKLAGNVSDGFAKVDKEFSDQRDRDAKTEEKLREFALSAAKQEAAVRGIPDKIKDLGISLEQLNDRMAKANAAPGGGPPRNPPIAPRPRAAAAPARAIRIEPGQKVDVILKDDHLYSGSLVAFDGQKVLVQTIPDPNAKPSEWDIRKVQAFQTRDGMFAYNEALAQFEPAITFFRFNKSNQKMERIEDSQDTYMAQDAKIYGPTNSVRALLSVGPSGEWCVGLPLPASRSPDSLDAYHFKEIVTPKGVYTYSEQKQDYEYRSHIEIARAAKDANDKGWEAYRQKNWDRRVQEFQLGTERFKALAPLFWSWRTWW